MGRVQLTVWLAAGVVACGSAGSEDDPLTERDAGVSGADASVAGERPDAGPRTDTSVGNDAGNDLEARRAVFVRGEDTILVRQLVGPSGGTLTGPADSPVAGVTVTFPAGALEAETEISLGFNDGVLRGTAGEWTGVALLIESAGTTVFEKPVVYTMPMDEGARIAEPYYVDDADVLRAMVTADVDLATRTVSFESYYASIYLVTGLTEQSCDLLLDTSIPAQRGYRTDFVPSRDGFRFQNFRHVDRSLLP